MMSWINNFNIGSRIYASFTFILIMLGAIAASAYNNLGIISGLQRDYVAYAENALMVQQIDRNLVELRRNIYIYLTSGSMPEFKRATELVGLIKGEFNTLDRSLTDPHLRQQSSALQKAIDIFSSSSHKAVEIREARDWIMETGFIPNTESASINLNRSMDAAMQAGKFELAARLANAKEAIWALRYMTEHFEETGDVSDSTKARTELERLQTTVINIMALTDDQALRQRIDKAHQRVDDLAATFEKQVGYITSYRELTNKTLADQANVIRELAPALTDDIRRGLNKLDHEVATSIQNTIRSTITISVAVVLSGVLISWVIGRGLSLPIIGMTRTMTVLAAGDKNVSVPALTNRDEIGDMARAVQVFKENAIAMDRMQQEQETLRLAADEMRVTALEQMADKVEMESRNAVAQVVGVTTDMTSKAESMAAIAFRVGTNSEEVAAAANQSLVNAQTVAAACEQLTAAIHEIGRLVAQASTTTRSSVESSRIAEQTIQSLSQSVGRISEFTNMISDIAAQTNLLALNATIEAARAGAAGKGFAVVATEVKTLATQAAKATEEITRQINEVRAITQVAVNAVSEVGAQIAHIDEISASVAAAIEEEASATGEISRNVTETANAAQEVSSRIEQVATDAQSTQTSAMQVCEAASNVADNVAHLRSVLVQVVRTSTKEANRRQSPRYQAELTGKVTIGGLSTAVKVIDISAGGVLLAENLGAAADTQGVLTLDGFNRDLSFRIVGPFGGQSHLRFGLSERDQIEYNQYFDCITEGKHIAA